jgi:hypothetical protein
VVEGVTETARTKSIAFDDVDWPGHLAGQHVDDTVVTLTNEQPQEWSGRTGRIDFAFLK